MFEVSGNIIVVGVSVSESSSTRYRYLEEPSSIIFGLCSFSYTASNSCLLALTVIVLPFLNEWGSLLSSPELAFCFSLNSPKLPSFLLMRETREHGGLLLKCCPGDAVTPTLNQKWKRRCVECDTQDPRGMSSTTEAADAMDRYFQRFCKYERAPLSLPLSWVFWDHAFKIF